MATLSIDRTSRITITACLYVRRMRVGSTAVPIHEKHSTTSVQVRVRTVVAIDLSVCLCPVLSSPLHACGPIEPATAGMHCTHVGSESEWDDDDAWLLLQGYNNTWLLSTGGGRRGGQGRASGGRGRWAHPLVAGHGRGSGGGRPRVPLRLYATRHRLIPPASPISIPHACGCERRMLPQACTDRSTYRCMDGVVSIDQAIAS
jgi:hypothetical protein